MPEHMGTRTGWRDNIFPGTFKYADRVLRDRACLHAQARVEVGLSAARLIGGEVHVHTQAAENIHNCLTCLRVERIDQAGDEELDGGHGLILSLNQKQKFGMIAFL